MEKLFMILAVVGLAGCGEPQELPGITDPLRSVSEYTVFTPNNIGNIGMTHDPVLDLIVHARYDYTNSAKLVFTDYEVNFVQEIDVTALIDHIQGISYNFDNDSFWIWGTKKGVTHDPFTSAQGLIEVDRDGNLLDSVTPPDVVNYPGMIKYVGDGTAWLKANTRSLMYKIDLSDGSILDTFETNTGGEGFAFDDKGFVWVHDGVHIKKIRLASGAVSKQWDSPVYCENAEDMMFDGRGNLWISADEGLHCSIEGGNRAWKIVNPDYD